MLFVCGRLVVGWRVLAGAVCGGIMMVGVIVECGVAIWEADRMADVGQTLSIVKSR